MGFGRTVTVLGAAGFAGLGWAVAETHMFTMRFATAPVLPPGMAPRRILHLSDLHMTPRQRDKQRWVRGLARWEPDLVVVTGDFLGHRQAVPSALDAVAPLGDFPGVFVLGSNDYYAPHLLNPAQYLAGPSRLREDRGLLPWGDLVTGLLRMGWSDLDNRSTMLDLPGWRIDARGVDDPHLEMDRYDEVAGPFTATCDLRLGVTHAPYLRVVDAMAADGADLIMAGHTHGGQLRVPWLGALVTNCDLPRKYARGLFPYPDDDGRTWLEVSAGLGTSPFAPIRFACRPEATLLTLTGRGGGI